jgi:hypothetical protein
MAQDGAAQSPGDPKLSAQQRKWLGIDEDESVRVLNTGTRTVLLERSGLGGSAVPWDRDLVMSMDVRAFSIADVLHLLHASSKSGFVFFEDGDHEKSVYMHRGEVVFAASNQTVDRLGECLLRTGVITLEQHREAKSAYSPTARFGKILVERGFLTPRELWNGVKSQVEEIVRSLFSYSAGWLLFWEGEVRPDNVVRLSLPTRRLIAEGLRRRDELLRLLARLEAPGVEIVPVLGANAALSGTERAVFESLPRAGSFSEICQRSGIDPLSGARIVQHLRLIGSVKVTDGQKQPAGNDGAKPSQGGGDVVRDCVTAHLELLSELAAPIVAVEGGEGLRLRLEGVVEEVARRTPELLEGVEVGPAGGLAPEELTERALRIPGDRERKVRFALGELISYLEFELLNHPKISEPEVFLEGVEELRGRL